MKCSRFGAWRHIGPRFSPSIVGLHKEMRQFVEVLLKREHNSVRGEYERGGQLLVRFAPPVVQHALVGTVIVSSCDSIRAPDAWAAAAKQEGNTSVQPRANGTDMYDRWSVDEVPVPLVLCGIPEQPQENQRHCPALSM